MYLHPSTTYFGVHQTDSSFVPVSSIRIRSADVFIFTSPSGSRPATAPASSEVFLTCLSSSLNKFKLESESPGSSRFVFPGSQEGTCRPSWGEIRGRNQSFPPEKSDVVHLFKAALLIRKMTLLKIITVQISDENNQVLN